MRAHVAAGHRCLHAWVVGVARVAGERAHPARVPTAAAATAAGQRELVTPGARKGAAARRSAALPLLHGLIRLRAPTQPLGSERGGLGLRSAAHLLPRGSGRRAAAHGGAAAVCRSADGQTQISERPERSSLAPAHSRRSRPRTSALHAHRHGMVAMRSRGSRAPGLFGAACCVHGDEQRHHRLLEWLASRVISRFIGIGPGLTGLGQDDCLWDV